jgi:hypothetical protein
MGIAISGAVMTYALGANGLTAEQIESPESWTASPEVFLRSFSFTAHLINAFAIFSVVFSALRDGRPR